MFFEVKKLFESECKVLIQSKTIFEAISTIFLATIKEISLFTDNSIKK